MTIKLKKFDLENWKLLESLEKSATTNMYAAREDEEEYKRYIQNSQVYAIMKGDEAIGTISYKIQENGEALINGLTVKPEHRGKGIGKLAMSKILDEIGDKKCSLVVHPKNTPALLIYLSLGFLIKEWKNDYFGDGEPRLCLEKENIQ